MMDRAEIIDWLRTDEPERLQTLWRRADDVRRQHVGDAVHLRGLVEFSNYCSRGCHYCGLRVDHRDLPRYRLTAAQILECARLAARLGYGTLVMQSGEDAGITGPDLAEIISAIKAETELAITLSTGERSVEELRLWRSAGADRYLLRFETSNRELFDAIHPPRNGQPCDRIALLRQLREIGYEVGSGVMIGIPGQTYDDLARDLEVMVELELDMIGVGPYLPHPDTPLGRSFTPADPERFVPNTELQTYKVLALVRLLRPDANLPSTTALATLNQADGRELGLMRGANIVMPNLTPLHLRQQYEIYPAKACLQEDPQTFHQRLRARIEAMGRSVGRGRGDSPSYEARTNVPGTGARVR